MVAGSVVASLGCAGEPETAPGVEVVAAAAPASPVAVAAVAAPAGDPGSAACPGAADVVDPGVRGGAPGAGGPLPGLTPYEAALWNEGRFRTTEIEATCDTCSDVPPGTPIPPDSPRDTTNSAGLGARYNANTCTSGCHSQPALGGTSPAVNPSYAFASAKGATNVVPFFETVDGPNREVRFLFNPDGTRDGGVHQKFSVRGRSDALGCTLGQPDFEANRGNLAFRIPTPMFGLGLIDSIPDAEILAHKHEHPARRALLGIHGDTNNNANTGTIARFGWKAQNASIALFAGEAYNVEMGITNELFPQSKVEDYECNLGAEPNDVTRATTAEEFGNPTEVMADWMMFSLFMRFTDQPKPAPFDASAQRGELTFDRIGCAECHVPSMTTKSGPQGPQSDALKGVTVNLFSDLLIHHMGANLADNVIQGKAGPDQFRTAPLWGVGQRLFFLHDGRTRSLVDAIRAHYSEPSEAHGRTPAYPASEANQVVRNFVGLPPARQQDVINFLRDL
ncbi:MAG TPA: di-heme oxidoredictase family protein [Polyangia bacterium]|nr:di-heme oxidoredictase family protein [Polyangia bacterium]